MVELIDARAHVSISKSLRRAQRSGVVKIAPSFFNLTLGAHRDAATMCINKVFDQSRGSGSIYMLFSAAEAQAGTFKCATGAQVRAAITEYRSELQRLAPVLGAIRTRRHKTMAHIDPETITKPEDYVRESTVSFRQMDEVLGLAAAILGTFGRFYSGKSAPLDNPALNDSERLFEFISNALAKVTSG